MTRHEKCNFCHQQWATAAADWYYLSCGVGKIVFMGRQVEIVAGASLAQHQWTLELEGLDGISWNGPHWWIAHWLTWKWGPMIPRFWTTPLALCALWFLSMRRYQWCQQFYHISNNRLLSSSCENSNRFMVGAATEHSFQHRCVLLKISTPESLLRP